MVTEFFFVGMAIFHIFLILEEQISVESLVENQKSMLIMPPTLKKWGAYCFRVVRPFVCLFVCSSVRSKKN